MEYINREYFLFCSKRNVTTLLESANELIETFKDIVPESNFFEKSLSGGI